ncbi:MAG: FAD:protein transferase [Frankiales bacterium]|nr:FAD:protein transferase [Frankiales bacterium]
MTTPVPSTTGGVTFASRSWRALGTYVRLVLPEPMAMETAELLLADEISAADRACSRFRTDSELSRVNRNAGRPVPVSGYLMHAVDTAVRAAEMTGGLVDPLLGDAIIGAGYDRDFDALPLDGPPAVPGRTQGQAWRRIELDRTIGTVRIPRGSRLDLGSSAKALAAQEAARRITTATGSPVLVSLGGDIALAGPELSDGWPVRVAERPEDDGSGTVVVLRDGGLATSSTLLRRWRRAGRDLHHIIDPRTGAPAAPCWRTVTVAGATCVDANAASTGAIVMGPAAPEWLDSLGLPARLVGEDGTVTVVGGWPEETMAEAIA